MVMSSTRSSSIDLQGLMRTPWNVDIRLCCATNTNQSSDNGGKNGNKGLSDLGTNEVEYLKTDSYLDCSDLTGRCSGTDAPAHAPWCYTLLLWQ